MLVALGAVASAQHLGPTTPMGNVVALAGIVLSLTIALLAPRLRGETLRVLGFRRPASWRRAGLGAAAAAGVMLLVEWTAQLWILPRLLGVPPADTSRFDSLRGDPWALIGSLVIMWLTAALAEEVIYRGFLMGRLARLFRGTGRAWIAALLLSSLFFGLLHLYQGIGGVLMTACAGLMLGGVYLLSGRNLWVVILAHGLTNTVSYLMVALGWV
ncbi:MAG: CPBP family intramembrane glutamic endopeptidase [Acidobacteriota bacterium]